MTGGHQITIDVEVYCASCKGEKLPLMKLLDDVEHSEGEYECPQCWRVVIVSLRVGN